MHTACVASLWHCLRELLQAQRVALFNMFSAVCAACMATAAATLLTYCTMHAPTPVCCAPTHHRLAAACKLGVWKLCAITFLSLARCLCSASAVSSVNVGAVLHFNGFQRPLKALTAQVN
jgi:hypothetical protein